MLTDTELKEILESLKDADLQTQKLFEYDKLKADAEIRKAERKAVVSVAYLTRILNEIDRSADNEKYYKINPEILVRRVFLFLESGA
jgi:hypothetical protein